MPHFQFFLVPILLFLFNINSYSFILVSSLNQEIIDAIEAHYNENDTQEELDQEQLIEDLNFFLTHKIDINKATKSQLERLQFLSDRQIESLLYYIYQYGPVKDLSELKLVDGFYLQDIRNLLPYVTLNNSDDIKPLHVSEVFKYGKSEFLSRTDFQVEKKEGYYYPSEETLKHYPNKQYYTGEPFYESFRYKFRYKDRVYFGFTGEKDAGEPIWNKFHKGFDFYSAHFQINDILHHINTLVIGDYNILLGQGLMINTNFGLGKSAWVNNVETRFDGLRKYSSCNEYNFLRGVGITTQFGRMKYTGFYSYKYIDGPLDGKNFTSIKQDGYHRTLNEISRKNNVSVQILGFRSAFSYRDLELGFNFLGSCLGQTINPKESGYSYYYFKGRQQLSSSFDYRFRFRKFRCFGETAITDDYAVATLNAFTFRPTHYSAFTLLQRNYSKRYNLLYSSSFGESTQTSNESGAYLGVELTPFKYWKYATYIDIFKFPWMRYDVPAINTKGYDYLFQSIYTPNNKFEFIITFRFKEKDDRLLTNKSVKDTIIVPFDRSSYKLQLRYSPLHNFTLKTIFVGSYTCYHTKSSNYGGLFSQDVAYIFSKLPLSLQLRYEIFNINNYDNRIYTYENDILYAFSISSLYGRGYRYYLNLHYKPTKNLSIYFKIAQTTFNDRDFIGSGLDKIDNNHITTLHFLVRYTFSII